MLLEQWDFEKALQVRFEESMEDGARKIAENMKNKGMDVNEIMRYTGLTIDDVLKL